MDTPAIDAPITPSEAPEATPEKGSLGSVLGIVLIVILLVFGAFYVWGQRISEQRANQVLKATDSTDTGATQ